MKFTLFWRHDVWSLFYVSQNAVHFKILSFSVPIISLFINYALKFKYHPCRTKAIVTVLCHTSWYLEQPLSKTRPIQLKLFPRKHGPHKHSTFASDDVTQIQLSFYLILTIRTLIRPTTPDMTTYFSIYFKQFWPTQFSFIIKVMKFSLIFTLLSKTRWRL